MTDAQIDALKFYQGSHVFDDKEKVTIRFADLVTRGASAIDADVLMWIGRHYSEDEIVELPWSLPWRIWSIASTTPCRSNRIWGNDRNKCLKFEFVDKDDRVPSIAYVLGFYFRAVVIKC